MVSPEEKKYLDLVSGFRKCIAVKEGEASLVGSSDPQALFMRILSFTRLVAAGTAAAAAKSGTAASFLKNDRRITMVDLTRMPAGMRAT